MPLPANELAGYPYPVPTGLLHAAQPQIPFLRNSYMLHSPSSRPYGTFTRAKTAHVAYLKARLSPAGVCREGALGGCGSMFCMAWKGALHGV